MNNDELVVELAKMVSERQTKFVYYMLGLNITAIGFSVTQTVGEQLNYNHVLLGLAIVSWGFSIFCGFRFNEKTIVVMKMNIEMIRNGSANNDLNYSFNEKNARNFKWVQYGFYSGIVFFIIWHVIQMSTI